jgi:hypothetical protein
VGGLPSWVGWLNGLAIPLFAAGMVPTATHLAARVAAALCGPLPPAPWSARARLTYAIRGAAGVGMFLSGSLLVGFALGQQSPLSMLPTGVTPWLTAFVSVLGGYAALRSVARRLGVTVVDAGTWAGDLVVALVMLPRSLSHSEARWS